MKDKKKERLHWGQQNVGMPSQQIEDAIKMLSRQKEFKVVDFYAIHYYCDRLLFRELPELLDKDLSLEQLKLLSPEVIKVVYLLLIRDMLQKFRHHVIPPDYPQKWDIQVIEMFMMNLFELIDAPRQPYVDWIQLQKEGEEENSKLLIMGLSKQLGIEPGKLWVYHDSMCNIIKKDIYKK